MTLLLTAFLVLLLLGAPISISMLVPSVLYLIVNDIPLAIITQRLTQSLNSFPLLAIPLFILSGRILNEAGITERIFRFASNLVGGIRGGLGHVNVLGSMIFAGMSGVAIADLGGLGQVEIKAMRAHGYPARFTAGITATSSIIGPVIPPSIPLILFSVSSDASILALFAGGIIPGVIIGVALMVTVYIYARYHAMPVETWPTLRTLVKSFLAAFPALMAPVLLIGGMLSGVFSPTEAAAVTVVYAFLLATLGYRDMKVADIPKVICDVLPMISNLAFIIASGLLFAWILVIEQVPQVIVDFMVGFSQDKWVLLTIVVIGFLIIGCFVEASIVFIVIAPMLLPTLKSVGVDEVHFGVVTVVAMGIGMFTPPVGIALYMLQDMCKISFDEAVKAVLPFLGALVAALALITYYPPIVTFLPRYLGLH